MNYYTAWTQQGTVAHEMGHSFGLAHNFDTDRTIMNYYFNRSVNEPQPIDLNEINDLY